MKRITLNVDDKLHTEFKTICVSTKRSIKDVVALLIQEYTKQYITNLAHVSDNQKDQND